MPGDRLIPGTPDEWMARAKGDLALAKIQPPEGVILEDLCFHAQQAAEKAIKAVYQHFGWPFRYVHNLGELLTRLAARGIDIPDPINAAIVLTTYASHSRYPGATEAIGIDECRHAANLAERVVVWAESVISPPPM